MNFEYCRNNADRGKYRLCVAGLGKRESDCVFYVKVNKPTNADRIRSMSDEELAEYIFGLGNGPENCDGHCAYQDDCNAEGFNYNTCIKACIKGVTDWLKQPAKEE